MKRIIAIVGVVLGLLGSGAVAAWAGNTGPSQACNDGYPAGGEHDITTSPAHTSYELVTNSGGGTWGMVCYSSTPKGSSNPEAAGGRLKVERYPDGTVRLDCAGDRTAATMATVDCNGIVTPTDPSGLPGTTFSGMAQIGSTSPVTIGQTGAEGNPATGSDLPLDGDTTSAASLGTGTGTCTWVNGVPNCPGSATLAGITVNEADVVDTNQPGTGCVGVNSICLITNTGVGIGQDSGSTVAVTDPTGTTRTVNVPGHCVQVGASC